MQGGNADGEVIDTKGDEEGAWGKWHNAPVRGTAVSPNKARFQGEEKIANAMNGLNFFSMRNNHGSYVIPSTKNFIDGLQIKKCKVDQGATTSVLPIDNEEMLSAIFNMYPSESYDYPIQDFRTFGGDILGLIIKPRPSAEDARHFDIFLGTDIYPSAATIKTDLQKEFAIAASDNPITVDMIKMFKPIASTQRLDFFLCSADITSINKDPSKNGCFLIADKQKLANYIRADLLRRDNVLIGNNILGDSNLSSIKHGAVELFYDIMVNKLEVASWGMVADLYRSIEQSRYLGDEAADADDLNGIFPNDFIFEMDAAESQEAYEI